MISKDYIFDIGAEFFSCRATHIVAILKKLITYEINETQKTISKQCQDIPVLEEQLWDMKIEMKKCEEMLEFAEDVPSNIQGDYEDRDDSGDKIEKKLTNLINVSSKLE